MDDTLLAEQLWTAQGPQLDGDGKPVPATDGIKSYAEGFIAMMKAGIVTNIIGTVTGSAPPGGPLTAGAAQGGKIVIVGAVMAAKASKGNPIVAAPLTLEATAIATYITGAALIEWKANSILGQSTEVPPPTPAPGPLLSGSGLLGTFSGLDGSSLAAMAAPASQGPTKVAHYTALLDHLKVALVEYKANTVQGIMTGGSLTLGVAAGGTVS